ncbi:uncharacterized protein LOC121079621 [Cygnus olor]|uniref:uncharacterized protein LOC121079621 n=1 Tax=Cygnus olor TaxID=8869 RepID=UPI001ADE6DFF|nr:uncharacterized protein LOC121079621 [Cygnus olor]
MPRVATGSSASADSSCCPSCWLSSQEGSRLAGSKSRSGLAEQHSWGRQGGEMVLPPPPQSPSSRWGPAITAGAPACQIGSAPGQTDAESKEQLELPTRLHSLSLPGKGTGRHVALARLSAGRTRASDAGRVLGPWSGAGASEPAGCGAWARSSSLHQPLEAPGTNFAAGQSAQALRLHRNIQKLGPSMRELLCQQRGCRGTHPRLEITRRAAQSTLGTKRPPAVTPKALRNPSQAAKKRMRGSSVGHQAPSGARGAPQAAPAGARHAERCQEAVPVGRGRRQPSVRQQPHHSVRPAASAQGLLHPIPAACTASGGQGAPRHQHGPAWHRGSTISYPRPFFFFFGSARCSEQKFP